MIWGGGLMAAPVAGASGLPQGRGGRIDVAAGLHGRGLSRRPRHRRHREHPGTRTARPIRSSGRWRSRAAARPRRRSSPTSRASRAKPFHYLDKGTMAMIGRGAAIAQVQPGRRAPRQARLRGLARRPCRADDRRQQPGRTRSRAGRVDFFGKERAPQALDRSGEPRMDWEDDDVAVAAAGSQRRWGMTDDRTYDVIIIGSGAGGGTLAGHLAPSGKRILILERGDWLPREIENWDAGEVFVKNRYVSKDTWYDDKGKALPARDPLLRRRPDEVLRRRALSAPAGGLRGAHATTTASRPAWPISYDDLEPYYSKAEQLYEVHGNHDEDPTEPPSSSAPTRSRRCPTSRGSSSCPTTSSGPAIHPFHAPCGDPAARGRTCRSARASAAPRATASRRSSRPSPTPRSSASGLPSSIRTSRCVTNATVDRG